MFSHPNEPFKPLVRTQQKGKNKDETKEVLQYAGQVTRDVAHMYKFNMEDKFNKSKEWREKNPNAVMRRNNIALNLDDVTYKYASL